MPIHSAETVAEAQAQTYTLPESLEGCRQFAALVDGYKIAEELGHDFRVWPTEQEDLYHQTGQWNLNILELRLMLFFEFRADYMSGYTYHELDDLVDSLLLKLSELTGQPYQNSGTDSDQ